MSEDARLTSFRRTLVAMAATIAVVATGVTAYLDRSTQGFAALPGGSDHVAAATPSPRMAPAERWASPRALRIDMTPTGSIPTDRPPIKNVITNPSAGMPQ